MKLITSFFLAAFILNTARILKKRYRHKIQFCRRGGGSLPWQEHEAKKKIRYQINKRDPKIWLRLLQRHDQEVLYKTEMKSGKKKRQASNRKHSSPMVCRVENPDRHNHF